MILVPEEIRDLFTQNSVKKNLRITFPNGERADIINQNIISESMSFTESICSQDKFKLGLCEAPVIEFETVGVENIKGMEIEASIEVDVTSAEYVTKTVKFVDGTTSFIVEAVEGIIIDDTSVKVSAYLVESPETKVITITTANHENNTQKIDFLSNLGEMVEIVLSSSKLEEVNVHYSVGHIVDDVKYPIYSIPLGRYIVESCPMKADLFDKREVTAYGKGFDLNRVSVIEQQKRRYLTGKTYGFDILSYAASNLNFLDESTIYWSKKTTTNESASIGGNFGEYLVDVSVSYAKLDIGYLYQSSLYKISNKVTAKTKEYVSNYVKEYLETLFDDISAYEYEYITSIEERLDTVIYPYITGSLFGTVTLSDNTDIIYPFVRNDNENDLFTIYVPKQINLEVYKNTGEKIKSEVIMEYDDSSIYSGSIDSKYKFFYELDNYNGSDIDFRAIFESYIELLGAFGKHSRKKGFEFLKIGNNFALYPSEDLFPSDELYPSDGGAYIEKTEYSSLWYEDMQTLPYGRVSASYLKTDGNTGYSFIDIPKHQIYKDVAELGRYNITKSTISIDLSAITFTQNAFFVESDIPIKSAYLSKYSGGSAERMDIEMPSEQTSIEWIGNVQRYDTLELTFSGTEYSGEIVLGEFAKELTYYSNSECQVYHISNNEILNTQKFEEDEVKEFLQTIADSIKNVCYMPAELEMQALPFLESGDVIQVADKFQTLILRRTITGIQSLMDSIESKG